MKDGAMVDTLTCQRGHHEVKILDTQIKQFKHLGEGAGHARLNYSWNGCRYESPHLVVGLLFGPPC